MFWRLQDSADAATLEIREKVSFPGAIRAEGNPYNSCDSQVGKTRPSVPRRRTGWGPTLGSLRVVARRPREGEGKLSPCHFLAGAFDEGGGDSASGQPLELRLR